MKLLAVDLRTSSAAVTLGLALLTVALAAAAVIQGLRWWSVEQSLATAAVAVRSETAVPPPSEPDLINPPAHEPDVRSLLRLSGAPLAAVLQQVEQIQLPGVEIMEIDVAGESRLATVRVSAASYADVLRYSEALGGVSAASRWEIVGMQRDASSGRVDAQLQLKF